MEDKPVIIIGHLNPAVVAGAEVLEDLFVLGAGGGGGHKIRTEEIVHEEEEVGCCGGLVVCLF